MSGLAWRHYGPPPRRDRPHRARRHGLAHRPRPEQAAPRSRCADEQGRAQHRADCAPRPLALGTLRERPRERPPAVPLDPPTHYTTLGITRSATDEEVRRAYKRQREIYSSGGLAILVVPDRGPAEERARATRRSVRHAPRPDSSARLRPLHVPRPGRAGVRRRALGSPCPRRRAAHAPGGARARNRPRHGLHRRAPAQGARESQGIELGEISAKTKIGRSHPRRDRGRALRRPTRDRLRARFPGRGGEVPEGGPGPGPEDSTCGACAAPPRRGRRAISVPSKREVRVPSAAPPKEGAPEKDTATDALFGVALFVLGAAPAPLCRPLLER